MAGRPPKEGLDYFPMEVGFFGDDKIEKLEGEHGPLGTYVFMRLLCLIYKDNGFYYTWDDSARALMAKRTGGACTAQKADLIVRSCVKWSLFDGTLLDECCVLTSHGIQRRFLYAIRERAKKAAAAGRQICVDERFWLLDEKTTAESFVKVGLFPENAGNNGNFSPEKLDYSPEESPKEKKRRVKEKEKRERGAQTARPSAPPAAAPSHVVGVVTIPKMDYEDLCRQYGRQTVDAKIIHMDAWIRDGGRMPRSCSTKLRDWLTTDQQQDSRSAYEPRPATVGKRVSAQNYEQRVYTDEELEALLYTDWDNLIKD